MLRSLDTARLLLLTGVLGCCVLASTGCEDRTQPLAPAQRASITERVPSDPALLLSRESGPSDLDHRWAAIARDELPGFAGLHRAEPDGRVVLSVVGEDRRSAATDWATVHLAGEVARRGTVEVRTVQYSFDQLAPWKDLMTPLLADERFRWIDIDEVKNRIVFGVDDTRIRSELLAAAERRGVPSQALDVVAAEAVADRSDVRDRLRPVPGGVKIDRPGSTDDLCTLGFSAYQSETRYFVTASHCSTSTYRTDGTIQYQSSDNRPADAIGFEANDPPYSWFSRFSDAALYEYEIPFDSVAWGRIAHPQYYSVNQPGSIEIDTVTPNFRIVSKGENSDQLVGEVVNKVGMISGWTQGQITQTCVTRQGLFCQWVALVYSQVGDSGSPVFQQVDPQGSYPEDVALWGVLHSGPIGDYSTSWYSPLDNVESDLGYLDVACPSSPASCYPPVFATVSGPTSVSGSGVKVWTGSASGGTGSYSMAWDHRINHSEGTCLYQTSWQQVGTGTSYSRYVLSTDYDFQLRLRVTSGSQTVHEYHWVFVTSSNPPCPN